MSNRFGDCWVDTVMRRKYVEVTKDLRRELKTRRETLVHSGGDLDTRGLYETRTLSCTDGHRCSMEFLAWTSKGVEDGALQNE